MCLTFANDDHSVNRPPKDYLIEILSHSYNNPNVIVRYSLLPPPPPPSPPLLVASFGL